MTGLPEAARMLETVSVEELRLWVSAGWVVPDSGSGAPRFSEVDLARARLIHELRSDLALDEDTVSLVLSMLDQIHGLRRELRRLAEAVAGQPETVRRAIAEACRDDGEA